MPESCKTNRARSGAVNVSDIEALTGVLEETGKARTPRHQKTLQHSGNGKTKDSDPRAFLFEKVGRVEACRDHRHLVAAYRQRPAQPGDRPRHPAVGPGRLVERADVEYAQSRSPPGRCVRSCDYLSEAAGGRPAPTNLTHTRHARTAGR